MDKLAYKIKVGITMGDPAGIGPQIILKAMGKVLRLADFVLIADKWVLDQVPVARRHLRGLKVIDLNNVRHKSFRFGKVKADYGKASFEYLGKALELIKNKEIDCLVTCPVSKEAISLAGINDFSGHTEYLAARTNTKYFVMMLLNRRLMFSLVTRHIPLKDVAAELNTDKISKVITLTYRYLKELFLIKNPRIVVCGLNPHASDNGLLGEEENTIIKPALKGLGAGIKDIDGPLPADIAIQKAARKEYDCVIAMYHDQALIPLKILDAYRGVNLTLGLPFVRTSPLHGTAFDIAGKFNLADPTSLIEAIRLALRCTLNQKNH